MEYLKQGDKYDQAMMQTERNVISYIALKDEDITSATEAANDLSKLMKQGNARQTAVRQWFKFKVDGQ